jgi:hypothetical protein
VEIDECLEAEHASMTMPCNVGAKCVDGVDSFACQCPNGWTGPTCEVNVDECSTSATGGGNPCSNGGTCFDTYGGYLCQCPPGFVGSRCEKRAKEAAAFVPPPPPPPPPAPAPAPPGIENEVKTASPDVGLCSKIQCIENSRCIVLGGSPRCVCLEGFAGK